MSVAAAVLVFLGWRRGGRAWLALTGWLLAFGSILPWSAALGPQIGLCYAIMVFTCLVWTEVAFNMEASRAAVPSAAREFQTLQLPRLRSCSRHGVLFLLAVPGACMATLLLTVALVVPLAWAMPAKVALAIFLFPVLWGAFSVWICAQDHMLKPILASFAILALSSLILLI